MQELFDTWETTLNVAIAATKLKGKLLKKKAAREAAEAEPPKSPSPIGKRPTRPAKGPDPSVFK